MAAATDQPGDGTFTPRPVLRPREQVERHIRTAILDGTLQGGRRLPSEARLAQDFGVSRTTVREALRSLSAGGFIRKVPGAGGGSFVMDIDPGAFEGSLADSMHNLLRLGRVEVTEVAAVRSYLEVPATRLAALHRTEDDLAELESLLDQAKRMSFDDPAVPGLDASFHSAVASASHNPILGSFVGALHTVTQPVHFIDVSATFGREAFEQHRRIVAAIAERDAAGAEQAIVDHLDYVERHMGPRDRSVAG